MFPPITNCREITDSYVIALILILRTQEPNVKATLCEREMLYKDFIRLCPGRVRTELQKVRDLPPLQTDSQQSNMLFPTKSYPNYERLVYCGYARTVP